MGSIGSRKPLRLDSAYGHMVAFKT